MANKLIPVDARRAAARGFIRTGAQALASAIPTGAIAITLSGDWLLGAALGIGGAILTSVAAGAISYFSILSKGIPEEYITE